MWYARMRDKPFYIYIPLHLSVHFIISSNNILIVVKIVILIVVLIVVYYKIKKYLFYKFLKIWKTTTFPTDKTYHKK